MCIDSFLAMPAEHVYVPNMTSLMTAEDLLKPGVPERADLVRGVLVVHEPPGFRHGEITMRLIIALGTYVDTPHLVVEVLSPGDRPGETLAKIADWLSAGTRLVWVIDPERRLARIYRQDGSESILAEADALEGEDILPGFACKLGAVLGTIV